VLTQFSIDLKIEPSAFASGKSVYRMTKEMEDLFTARFGTLPGSFGDIFDRRFV
jgi:hypothetical protein